MAKLVLAGVSYELVEHLITIGRASDNMIFLEDPSVSGHHAELRAVGKTYQLKDLGSTNGTRINGNPITETQLGHGDRIRFGGVDARFESIDPTATQPLPQVQPIEAAPASTSAAPTNFADASPFPRRRKQADKVRLALFGIATIAILAFLVSMIAVLLMHVPAV